ncbi:glutamate racemase [Zooshikella ganghwensis]|uniref:glutamate racemase n=1 Tax=Zooshikella ganghwensis TaxID=202772 RepID=UPI00042329AB|nr:glutamate racemase [Zooshikella ganghwensis]
MAKVVIFDSGVGGLSIFSELVRLMPEVSVVYASDNAAYPYGDKSERYLKTRVKACLDTLVQYHQPDMVVVACNTASTVVLPVLRAHFSIPVVGVVPAIKTAAQVTNNGVIGLLATPGTVTRVYTDDLIIRFAKHCDVIKVGSRVLVDLAEAKLRSQTVDLSRLKQELLPFEQAPVRPDTIVLGCTHFPLLLSELQQISPSIHWVDSGSAIARRVRTLLEQQKKLKPEHAGIYQAMFTANTTSVTQLKPYLFQLGFSALSILPIDEAFTVFSEPMAINAVTVS